ncbi:MAG: hypothetical protein J1F33_05550 [Clostridiales bacterium]|nr:hypothetical protein [Clostridiales bacterium]
MKYLIKKIAVALTLIMAFTLCLALAGCSCDHDFQYVKSIETYNGGCREQYQCTKCNEFKYEDVTHSYSSTKTTSATCEEKGGTYKECTKCGHRDYEKEIQPLGHNYITESGSGYAWSYEYEESTKCKRCGTPYYMLITTRAWITSYSGSSYLTFKGTIYNRLKKLTYVKAKLIIYNEYGRVVHTDWTYAVSSMPLEVGESTSFELMVNRSYCYGLEYFRWEYYA